MKKDLNSQFSEMQTQSFIRYIRKEIAWFNQNTNLLVRVIFKTLKTIFELKLEKKAQYLMSLKDLPFGGKIKCSLVLTNLKEIFLQLLLLRFDIIHIKEVRAINDIDYPKIKLWFDNFINNEIEKIDLDLIGKDFIQDQFNQVLIHKSKK